VKRRSPPPALTSAFHQAGLKVFRVSGPETRDQPLRLYDGGPACWLKQFDPLDRPCSGDLEVIHLIGRQRISKVLRHQLVTDLWAEGAIDPLDVDDLVELAEWDIRNGAPGCEGHHRRVAGHLTPTFQIPVRRLFVPAVEFIVEHGFEVEAERKFEGDLEGWEMYQRIAGTGAEVGGVGVAPFSDGLSADSGERPSDDQQRSDK
jgi:hypothetical protein